MIGRSAFIGASLALATAATGAKPGDAAGVGLVEQAGEFDVAAFMKRVSRDADVRHVWDAGKLYPQILELIREPNLRTVTLHDAFYGR